MNIMLYQNYFLIIRSDKECKVNIEIDKQEIEPMRHPVQQPVQQPVQHPGQCSM